MTDELVPDTKDWTWVLERPCPECGLVTGEVPLARLGEEIRRNAESWASALLGPGVEVRPRPETWSVLEYACHVRDVHLVMADRAALIELKDDPTFPNWDQDATAVEERYADQDPAVVSVELRDAASAVADRYDRVPDAAWERIGRRSNGSVFTLAGLGRYHLHDVVHHLHDIAGPIKQATIAAYDTAALAYREARQPMPDVHAGLLAKFAGTLPAEARVLEIGSGPGRDAQWLESMGVEVRRTDISPAFVALLRADGRPADVIDPLTDDLTDPAAPGSPYDGVWASACLLHVARSDVPVVLRRLAEVTRAGGKLHVSVKEGDGEVWSTHGAVDQPRHFTLWREGPLRAALETAGWTVDELTRQPGLRTDEWIDVFATRTPTEGQVAE